MINPVHSHSCRHIFRDDDKKNSVMCKATITEMYVLMSNIDMVVDQ